MDKLFFYDTELGRLGIRDNSQNITNLYFESILDSANSVFLISEFSCGVMDTLRSVMEYNSRITNTQRRKYYA